MRARHAHPDTLSAQAKLTALNLPFMREHYQPLAKTAADAYFGDRDRSFRLKVTGHFGAS